MLNLLTEDQAAAELHVCTRTLRRMRQRGEIRYVAVTARTILYRPEDVAAFVEQRATVQHSPGPHHKVRPSRKRRNVDSDAVVISFDPRRAQRRGLA